MSTTDSVDSDTHLALIDWPEDGLTYYVSALRTLTALGASMPLYMLIDICFNAYMCQVDEFEMAEYAVSISEVMHDCGILIDPTDESIIKLVAILEEVCLLLVQFVRERFGRKISDANAKVKQVSPAGILLEIEHDAR